MCGLDILLNEIIPAEGPITVARYMELCLGDPAWGYYSTEDPFGREGDFITSPEISQIFGELIGLWAADYWMRAGYPEQVRLVELGPGRGSLMADAVRALLAIGELPSPPDCHFVETSEYLRETQKAHLTGTWHEGIDSLPPGPAVYVANEFFDALPIHQFVYRDEGWRERRIAADEGALAWVEAEPSNLLRTVPQSRRQGAHPGGIMEWSAVGWKIGLELSTRIAADGGALLAIDYGYARPAFGDTFQAVRRHRFTDPLAEPGQADLTAHVDFSMLRHAAESQGARAWGPVLQGEFLTRLGINVRAERLKAAATSRQAADIDSAVKRLTSAEQMGQLFKAIAITAADGPDPAGF